MSGALLKKGTMKVPVARLFAEGLAIVVSILLAFAIDAAWDERQERGREAEILESLLSEFEGNRDRLPGRAAQHRRTVSAANALLVAVRSVGPGQAISVPDTLLLPTVLHGSYDPPMGALQTVIMSGDLQLVSNPELRERLAEWPARVLDASENEAILRENAAPRYRDVLMRDIDVAAIMELLNPSDLDGPLRSNTMVELVATTELASLLGEIRVWAAEAAREQLVLAELADDVATMIRGQLSPP